MYKSVEGSLHVKEGKTDLQNVPMSHSVLQPILIHSCMTFLLIMLLLFILFLLKRIEEFVSDLFAGISSQEEEGGTQNCNS